MCSRTLHDLGFATLSRVLDHFHGRFQVIPDWLAALRSSSLHVGSSLRKVPTRRPARLVRSFVNATNEPAHSGQVG